MARGKRMDKEGKLRAELKKIEENLQALKEKEKALIAKKNTLEKELEEGKKDAILDLISKSGLSFDEVAELIKTKEQ